MDTTPHQSARKKFLALSLESTRKSYYPQLQKHLEKTKENEKRLQLLIDNLPAQISYVNSEERFRLVNREFEESFGKKRDQIIGRRIKSIIGEKNYNKVKSHIEKALSGQSGHFEYSVVTRDSTTKWYEINYVSETDHKGVVSGFYILTIDLTEKKEAEKEHEKLQAQLAQAQKMESVGRLAGGVAHDFNNMLSIILGHVDLALDQVNPSKPLHNNLQQILKAARRSTDIVRQLLAFARKQTITPKVLDLNSIVEKMLQMLRRLIGEDIDLLWKPTKNLWAVKIDPSQIDQILVNLSVNARDAIAGVGKLTIETGMVSFDQAYCLEHAGFIPGDFVLLAVSDNGCGMNKETLDNLFEPFFTTKGAGKGTGLGLAMVYGIVKQNNGFINVYSELNQGTAFRIYLPRHHSEPGEIPRESSVKIPSGQGETILVVEDDTDILDLIRIILEDLGYSVLTAASPGEAIQQSKAYAGRIHLLMTDVVMPEMNGRDLAKQLIALYPNLKLLFMSGYTSNVIAHQGVLDEGVQFIQKPFSRKDLAVKVREVLAEKKQAAL